MFMDVVFLIAVLMTLGSYSRGYASLRVALARERSDPRERIALLLPFVGKRARFDPRGEAFELLAEAAEKCGERELARVCREHLAQSRRDGKLG